MKLICNKQALTSAVNVAQKAVAARSTLPILEGLLLKAKGGQLMLTGNDLEIGIDCLIESEVEREGSVVVNSRLFGDIVRKLSGESVTIEVNQSQVTTIKCGNSKFNINGIPSEEFPEIHKFHVEYTLSITQRQMRDLIKSTIFAVGTSDAKPILTGCLLEAAGKQVNMVAVDGFRLALKKIQCENDVVSGDTTDVGFVIPAKTLQELLKILEETDDIIQILCSEKNVRFEFDNVIFTSRLLEGDYIDYKKIIPEQFNTTVQTEVKPLLDSVERASLMITSEVTKSPIVIKIEDAQMMLTCETQVGKVEELIPVNMRGESQLIGFNNKYLLDALKSATGESVDIHLIGSINPCLITPANGDDFKFIVLPVRLKNEN